jgi:hypothetical protein
MLLLSLAFALAVFPAGTAAPDRATPWPTPRQFMPDSTQSYYARKDAGALRRLLRRADTRAERLLCRYRLYPLTEDERYLDDLPETLGSSASARELALLSGLWGYRAAHASIFGAMQAGRRSMRLLEQAREKDADAPFVLLVGGQSLLFRPAIAGGSDEAALARFQRLRRVLSTDDAASDGDAAVASLEAALWTWYALRETDRSDDADALHQKLVARDLPPLYREFLKHPPG